MSTAVVLGGGVSGLAAVYYLQRISSARFTKIILLEASDRLGGWMRSTKYENGGIFEHGPRSLRPVGEVGFNTLLLAEDLGLSDEILPSLSTSAAAKNRFIYANEQMHTLPNSLKSIVTTQSPFSKPLLWSVFKEIFAKKSDNSQETVHSFFTRRFGPEIADYLVNPMCRGIFAGDCHEMSVDACFPMLTQLERDHGSLILGMLASKKRELPPSDLVKRSRAERWMSWSLKSGMQRLTDKMEEVIGHDNRTEVRKSSPCNGLELLKDGKIKVKTNGEDITANHVFSAIYAKKLAKLLPASPVRDNLNKIPAISAVVVNLEYKGRQLPREGFGHLLPSFESGPILGVVYDSCAFPLHNRKDMSDSTRLTVMLGGAWFQELSELTGLEDSRLTQLSVDAVREQLGITETPIQTAVAVQLDCIPQYIVGHKENLTATEKYIDDARIPLTLIGASYRGPSINDCIFNTRTAVERVAQSSCRWASMTL